VQILTFVRLVWRFDVRAFATRDFAIRAFVVRAFGVAGIVGDGFIHPEVRTFVNLGTDNVH